MLTLRQVRLQTYKNLATLKEREISWAGNAPLELLNQIGDHEKALTLLNEAIDTALTERQLERLKTELRPLLVAGNIEQIALDQLVPETPRRPFEPETVPVAAGPFLLGSDDEAPESAPRHQLTLPAFRIGKYPVTNAQYAEFIRRVPAQPPPRKSGWVARRPPPQRLQHPVVGVSWDDALAYCAWLTQETGRSYRLPTEAEWEKAAGWDGEQKRRYPWGQEFSPQRCNGAPAGPDDTTPVGQFSPEGDSPAGCADMAGNVQEWVSTLWGTEIDRSDYPYPYRPDDGREDLTAERRLHRVFRLHRGGAFRDDPARLTCAARAYSDPDSKLKWRGFRVVEEV